VANDVFVILFLALLVGGYVLLPKEKRESYKLSITIKKHLNMKNILITNKTTLSSKNKISTDVRCFFFGRHIWSRKNEPCKLLA